VSPCDDYQAWACRALVVTYSRRRRSHGGYDCDHGPRGEFEIRSTIVTLRRYAPTAFVAIHSCCLIAPRPEHVVGRVNPKNKRTSHFSTRLPAATRAPTHVADTRSKSHRNVSSPNLIPTPQRQTSPFIRMNPSSAKSTDRADETTLRHVD
jgi:hypothetical protein